MAKSRKPSPGRSRSKPDAEPHDDTFGHTGTHECKAADCSIAVPRSKAFCPRHWSMLPVDLQRQLYAAYEEWQKGEEAFPPSGQEFPTVKKLREMQERSASAIAEIESRKSSE